VALETFKELGDAVYYGNALRNWGEAFVTFGLWFTVLPLARATIGRQLARRTPITRSTSCCCSGR
jgi:hypothetical protein